MSEVKNMGERNGTRSFRSSAAARSSVLRHEVTHGWISSVDTECQRGEVTPDQISILGVELRLTCSYPTPDGSRSRAICVPQHRRLSLPTCKVGVLVNPSPPLAHDTWYTTHASAWKCVVVFISTVRA